MFREIIAEREVQTPDLEQINARPPSPGPDTPHALIWRRGVLTFNIKGVSQFTSLYKNEWVPEIRTLSPQFPHFVQILECKITLFLLLPDIFMSCSQQVGECWALLPRLS